MYSSLFIIYQIEIGKVVEKTDVET